MFSKKHYIAIAKVIKSLHNSALKDYEVAIVTSRFVTMFEKDNSKFNTIKFVRAIFDSD